MGDHRWCQDAAPVNRQRGLTLLVTLGIALAILVTLAGIGRAIFKAGVDHEKAAQAVRDAKAQAAADEIKLQRTEDARDNSVALSVANAAANAYEAKWRIARGNNRGPLATAECQNAASGGAPGVPDSAAPDGGGVRLRLTAEFLREYDGAWTNADGKPVFVDSGGPTDPAGDTVTLETLLATHAENAARCSRTSRRLTSLITLVRKLQGRAAPSP